MKITAVHYEADSSSLALGRHEYQGTDDEEVEGSWLMRRESMLITQIKNFNCRQQQSEAE